MEELTDLAFDLEVSDTAIADFLANLSVVGDDDDDTDLEVAPSPAVKELGRRLMGQQIELLTSLASGVFRDRSRKSAGEQLEATVLSLIRMAEGAADDELVAHLSGLPTPVGETRAARVRYLRALHSWTLGLADFVSSDDERKLRSVFEYRKMSIPLLEELRCLKGIGPRRIERLYCAGLYTVEAVGQADPRELAQVTGLPTSLARQVVKATRTFARRQREECIDSLYQRALQLERILGTGGSGLNDDAVKMIQATLGSIQRGVRLLEDSRSDVDEAELAADLSSESLLHEEDDESIGPIGEDEGEGELELDDEAGLPEVISEVEAPPEGWELGEADYESDCSISIEDESHAALDARPREGL